MIIDILEKYLHAAGHKKSVIDSVCVFIRNIHREPKWALLKIAMLRVTRDPFRGIALSAYGRQLKLEKIKGEFIDATLKDRLAQMMIIELQLEVGRSATLSQDERSLLLGFSQMVEDLYLLCPVENLTKASLVRETMQHAERIFEQSKLRRVERAAHLLLLGTGSAPDHTILMMAEPNWPKQVRRLTLVLDRILDEPEIKAIKTAYQNRLKYSGKSVKNLTLQSELRQTQAWTAFCSPTLSFAKTAIKIAALVAVVAEMGDDPLTQEFRE